MNVSAIIVTRGDVDVLPVLDSLPEEWEKIVWDNRGFCQIRRPTEVFSEYATGSPDIAVYGRYAAIEYASHDIIYVQDDDVIVRDPRAIVHAWLIATGREGHPRDTIVCNMPSEFRHEFYIDHALVGFGAAFHRTVPDLAFTRFGLSSHSNGAIAWGVDGVDQGFFDRTCDIIVTALTPRVLVDVPKTNLPYAESENRMYRQPEHQAERSQMLRLALKVKENQ